MNGQGKNIVICCDGTGQSIPVAERAKDLGSANPGRSNVLRLFDLLVKDSPYQVCWYDPGIGMIPLLEREQRTMRWMRNVRDEWLGLGLMDSVGEAYLHLMEQVRARRPDLPDRIQPRRVHRPRARRDDSLRRVTSARKP